MKPILCLLALLLFSPNTYGQTVYSGAIDQFPIELVADVTTGGSATAIYSYSNFDEPIRLSGKLQRATLVLFEKDAQGKNRATLTFPGFNDSSSKVDGAWKDLRSGKQRKITLNRLFSVEAGESFSWSNRELLQPVSAGNRYFKLLVSKGPDKYYPRVTGVRIFEKKTDRLLQQIEVDCQLSGLHNIDTGDYNFDGLTDFSVFESSYAGPNTSSLYYLYDSAAGTLYDSGFSGISLEFDSGYKRIYERNSCCAGTSITTAEYKVEHNSMVLIERHCLKWDERRQEMVERKPEDCN